MFAFFPRHLPDYHDYVFFDKSHGNFSKEECEKIISLFEENKKTEAKTGGQAGSLLTHIPNDKRKSHISWIGYNEKTHWIFEKLTRFVEGANTRYGFQLNGFFESLQITEYQEGDHYDWHTDHGPAEFSVRKLSIVVQLSDPNDYEGGVLQIQQHQVQEKNQGDVILFPSFSAHKVWPVTKGKRYSLVAWVTGEPFR